jgi:putative oxidoreductase
MTWMGGIERRGVDLGLLVLRVGIGATMLLGHGWGKVGMLVEAPAEFADPLGVGPTLTLLVAVLGEAVGSALIIVGWLTRLATLPLLATMLTAFFVVHGDDPFEVAERSLLFAIPALTLLLTGAGRHSVDGWLARRG